MLGGPASGVDGLWVGRGSDIIFFEVIRKFVVEREEDIFSALVFERSLHCYRLTF